jgi:hypothetical protein
MTCRAVLAVLVLRINVGFVFRSLAIFFLIGLVRSYGQGTLLDFEELQGMFFFDGGAPVPEASRLGTEELSKGVTFSSRGGFAAVVNLGAGHATSGINGFAGVNLAGGLDYSAFVSVVFSVPGYPQVAATTDFLSVRSDQFGGGPANSILAYDVHGHFLVSDDKADSGGATLSVSVPGIHQVILRGNGGTGFDDLRFNPLKSTKVIIDFENFSGMGFAAGNTVPAFARITDRYASLGLLLSSARGYAALVELGTGHAVSGVNGLGAVNASGQLDYESPIELRFISPTNSSLPAITDYVSINIDRLHTMGSGHYLLEAYDITGQLIASVTGVDANSPPAILQVAGIHRVLLYGSGSTAFDDLIFDPIEVVEPYIDTARSGEMLEVRWPAAFNDFLLEQTSNLGTPILWERVSATPVLDNGNFAVAFPISSTANRFFRLRNDTP